MLEYFFNKVAGFKLLKRDFAQVFSCKFCETFKSTYFKELLRATASVHSFHGWKIGVLSNDYINISFTIYRYKVYIAQYLLVITCERFALLAWALYLRVFRLIRGESLNFDLI